MPQKYSPELQASTSQIIEKTEHYTTIKVPNGKVRVVYGSHEKPVDTNAIIGDYVLFELGGSDHSHGTTGQYCKMPYASSLPQWAEKDTFRRILVCDSTGIGQMTSFTVDNGLIGVLGATGALSLRDGIRGHATKKKRERSGQDGTSTQEKFSATRRSVIGALGAFFATPLVAELLNYGTTKLDTAPALGRSILHTSRKAHPWLNNFAKKARERVMAYAAIYALKKAERPNNAATIFVGSAHVSIEDYLVMDQQQLLHEILDDCSFFQSLKKDQNHRSDDYDQFNPAAVALILAGGISDIGVWEEATVINEDILNGMVERGTITKRIDHLLPSAQYRVIEKGTVEKREELSQLLWKTR